MMLAVVVDHDPPRPPAHVRVRGPRTPRVEHELQLRLGQAGVHERQAQRGLRGRISAHPHQLQRRPRRPHALEPPGADQRRSQRRRRRARRCPACRRPGLTHDGVARRHDRFDHAGPHQRCEVGPGPLQARDSDAVQHVDILGRDGACMGRHLVPPARTARVRSRDMDGAILGEERRQWDLVEEQGGEMGGDAAARLDHRGCLLGAEGRRCLPVPERGPRAERVRGAPMHPVRDASHVAGAHAVHGQTGRGEIGAGEQRRGADDVGERDGRDWHDSSLPGGVQAPRSHPGAMGTTAGRMRPVQRRRSRLLRSDRPPGSRARQRPDPASAGSSARVAATSSHSIVKIRMPSAAMYR